MAPTADRRPGRHRPARREPGCRVACFLVTLAGAGCTDAPPLRRPALDAPAEAKVALGEDWFAARAQTLGLTLEAAKARDRAIARDRPPAGRFWDEQLALQSASVWRLVCNECHPGRRGIGSALEIPPSPPGWGEGQGQFFGRSRSYGDVYDTIARGVSQPGGATAMPAFEGRLAHEQIWGMIRFLEHASSQGGR